MEYDNRGNFIGAKYATWYVEPGASSLNAEIDEAESFELAGHKKNIDLLKEGQFQLGYEKGLSNFSARYIEGGIVEIVRTSFETKVEEGEEIKVKFEDIILKFPLKIDPASQIIDKILPKRVFGNFENAEDAREEDDFSWRDASIPRLINVSFSNPSSYQAMRKRDIEQAA